MGIRFQYRQMIKDMLSALHRIWIPAMLVVISLTIRCWDLSSKSLWLDEIYTILRASGTILESLQEIAYNDAHPPLFYMLFKLWNSIVPGDEFAMRLLPIVFDTLAVVFVYRFHRLFFDEKASFAASLVAACSCFMVQYAQEIRHYSLSGFLGIWSTYSLAAWILNTDAKKQKICYLLAVASGMYTFYYMAFLFCMHGFVLIAFVLHDRKYRSLFLQWIIIMVLCGILIIPWFSWVIPLKLQILPGTPQSGGFDQLEMAEIVGNFLWGDTGLAFQYSPFLIFGLVLLLFLNGLCIYRQNPSFPAWIFPFLLVLIVGTFILWLLFPFKGHIFQSKHLGFVMPLFWCIVGLCTVTAKTKICNWTGWALIFLLIAGNFLSLTSYYKTEKQAWRSASRYVFENLRPGDVVCFNPFYIQQPFHFYYNRLYPQNKEKRFTPGFSFHGKADETVVDSNERKYFYLSPSDLENTRHKNFWLVEVHRCSVTPPNPMLSQWCLAYYRLESRKVFPGFLGDIVIFSFKAPT